MKTNTISRRPKGFAMMEFFVLVSFVAIIAAVMIAGFCSCYKKSEVSEDGKSQKK